MSLSAAMLSRMTEILPTPYEPQAAAEDVALKLWIPERIDALLSELEDALYLGRSECVRALLLHYLHGSSGEHGSSEVGALLGHSVQTAPARLRGRWGGRIPQLGKNTVDVKLWIPAWVMEDLTRLAAQAGLSVSHFTREILVIQLLGHCYLPERKIVPLTLDDAQQQE